MTQRQVDMWLTEESEKELMGLARVKRKLVPDDIARFVLFMASDEAGPVQTVSVLQMAAGLRGQSGLYICPRLTHSPNSRTGQTGPPHPSLFQSPARPQAGPDSIFNCAQQLMQLAGRFSHPYSQGNAVRHWAERRRKAHAQWHGQNNPEPVCCRVIPAGKQLQLIQLFLII